MQRGLKPTFEIVQRTVVLHDNLKLNLDFVVGDGLSAVNRRVTGTPSIRAGLGGVPSVSARDAVAVVGDAFAVVSDAVDVAVVAVAVGAGVAGGLGFREVFAVPAVANDVGAVGAPPAPLSGEIGAEAG